MLFGCLLLLVVGIWFNLRVRIGAQRVELAWFEAGLVFSLALIPLPWAILLTPLAVAVCFAGRQPAVKLTYNAASYTIAAASAVGILVLFNIRPPFLGTDLLAVTVAGIIAALVTHIAVATVIAIVQDVSVFATWQASAWLQLLTLIGNLTVGVGLLALARYGPWAVAVVPVLVLCLHQAYRERVRSHEERDAGRKHAAAVGRLIKDLDETALLRRATEDACVLADVDVTDIEFPALGGAPAILHRHVRRGPGWTGDPSKAPSINARVVGDFPVPLGDGGSSSGRLRAWLAGGAPDLQLGRFEEEALSSLARHAGAAVRNARLHARQTHLATHDRLTDLPTRLVLIERIESAFQTGAWARCRGGSAGSNREPVEGRHRRR